VSDVDLAVHFYANARQTPPTFVLIENPDAAGRLNHPGVETDTALGHTDPPAGDLRTVDALDAGACATTDPPAGQGQEATVGCCC